MSGLFLEPMFVFVCVCVCVCMCSLPSSTAILESSKRSDRDLQTVAAHKSRLDLLIVCYTTEASLF